MTLCCGSEPISVDQSSQNSVSKNFGEKYVSDELTLQRRFGRERELRKGEAVAKGQPVSRPMHGAEVAVDNVRLVVERMLAIEREELLRDIDVG